MTIIHTLIVVASIRQRYISQLGVKNALLNGNLQNEVYIAPFSSFHITLGMFVSSRKRYMV